MGLAETPAMLARARAEEAVVFDGPSGPLAGIFTPPARVTGPLPRCVVFPARPRFASRRLAVNGARTLAAEGFACLRFDLHGHGESGGVTEPIDRDRPCGGDVEAALRYLREVRGYRRFLLVGYCFDALSALDAFRNEAAAIDGLFFAAGPVADSPVAENPIARNPSVEVARPHASRKTRNLLRTFAIRFSPRWLKPSAITLTRSSDQAPGDDQSPILDPLTPRSLINAAIANGPNGGSRKIMDSFDTAFAALTRSRASALFLYGDRDDAYDEFKLVEHRWFTAFDDATRDRIRLELWPGRVHSPDSEAATLRRAIEWARTFDRSHEVTHVQALR
jgi:alpha/beta superfamily hydrolase